MSDFYSPVVEIEYEEKIRRSTFLVTMRPIKSIAAAKDFIAAVSTKYKTASHNCWAYIVGNQGETFHASDAGEPSGTAGKPILNALQKNNLSNVATVVTRYFGGVKLGVRGLIDAYGGTVEKAIAAASLIRIREFKHYKLQTTYDFLDILKYNLNNLEVELKNLEYTDVIKMEAIVEKQNSEEVDKYIIELTESGKLLRLDLCKN